MISGKRGGRRDQEEEVRGEVWMLLEDQGRLMQPETLRALTLTLKGWTVLAGF